MLKKLNRHYFLLALLVVAYGLELFLIPPNEQALTRFNISPTTAKLLGLTIAIPLTFIWFMGFYGYTRVKQYANMSKDTKDGQALQIIGDGLMALALTLPLTTLSGNLRTYFSSRYPQLREELQIAQNYFSLFLTLFALWLIAFGAKKLVKTLKKKPISMSVVVVSAVFTAFSLIFTYLTLVDTNELGQTVGSRAYYLPDLLVLGTIVVPYVCMWYLGLRAAYHMHLYRIHAPGILYRKALGLLASGIGSVVVVFMLLRLMVSISSFLNSLSLQYLLIFLYVLVALIGVSFGLIASGAKKLKKIEEV